MKIPANLPTHDRTQLKALSVFFCLKMVRYTGVIYDYRKNTKVISESFGISPNNLKAKVKWLLANDYVRYEGKHLKLIAYSTVCEKLQIHERYIKCERLDVRSMEYFIYAVKIKENLRRQEYAVQKKLVVWETTQIDALIKNPELFDATEYPLLLKKTRQRSEKTMIKLARKFVTPRYDKLLQKHMNSQMILLRQSYMQRFNVVNPHITLSTSGVARVTKGSTSSATGWYLSRRLEQGGFITRTPQYINQVDTESVQRSLTRFNTWENPTWVKAKCGLYGFKNGYRTVETLINIEF